ncbi:MAG: formylglycine-generating enzyme family protein [Sphingorhabdus sp.]
MRWLWLATGLAVALMVGGLVYFISEKDNGRVCSGSVKNDMVFIPGGQFAMGSEDFYPEEAPVRIVNVKGFWIDRHELTNDEFARFVRATGYVTSAERADIAGTPTGSMAAGSAVFGPDTSNDAYSWRWSTGANWRHPEGPASSIDGRGTDPVVQISFEDAAAYARWAGKQLPTEEQWEYAARGGLEGRAYAWGDTARPGGKYRANSYQGPFPIRDTGDDGFAGRAPVGCFDANAYGLYDMTGNVWEWTASGPRATDPAPDDRPRAVIRGGSFLCSPNYCLRYRPAARQFQERDLGTNHVGVRFVKN